MIEYFIYKLKQCLRNCNITYSSNKFFFLITRWTFSDNWKQSYYLSHLTRESGTGRVVPDPETKFLAIKVTTETEMKLETLEQETDPNLKYSNPEHEEKKKL